MHSSFFHDKDVKLLIQTSDLDECDYSEDLGWNVTEHLSWQKTGKITPAFIQVWSLNMSEPHDSELG